MENLDIVGLDLAKNVFQLHGCSSTCEMIFRKQLRCSKLLSFISELPTCTIAMEACSGSHCWGREFETLGHLIRLIPPKYVKPFVKRSKCDAIDAEAVCEAALRPTMYYRAAILGLTRSACGTTLRLKWLPERDADLGHVAT